MNIVKATSRYEDWLARLTPVVRSDLKVKHKEMAKSAFPFLRATFYRWVQIWPEVCPKLARAPRVLGVGDLHIENFGTWRDTEGRLVWGINDFDETSQYPYTLDLVRLATSALLAIREGHFAVGPKRVCDAILGGYQKGMQEGGRPFVLGEQHDWLRAIAEKKLRDPVQFWKKIDELGTVKGKVPKGARKALERLLPQSGMKYRLVHRVAGLGSLGRLRFVAVADWKGGQLAREAKALLPSAIHWLSAKRPPREIFYSKILKNAVRCRDPWVDIRGPWIVRRLSPDCSRVELDSLAKGRSELQLLGAMGKETANIHLATERRRRAVLEDLRRKKPNWLVVAAEAMVQTTEKDWLAWKRGRTA